MQASFSVITADGVTLNEQQITDQFARLRAELTHLEDLEGVVILYNDVDSYRVTALRDVLGPLVSQLCFHAVTELAGGRNVTLTLYAYDERVQLQLDGDDVVIGGDDLPGDRCTKSALMTALVDCGDRFLALLQRAVADDDPDWAENRDSWIESAARARACLKS